MAHGSRLIILLLVLFIYAILSTSLLTKFLLNESNNVNVALSKNEVLVFDEESDDGKAANTNDDTEEAEETTDDDSTITRESPEEMKAPFVCNEEGAPDVLPSDDLVRRSLHGVIIGTQKGGTQALHNILLTHPEILTSSTGHGELHFFNFNRMYQKMVRSRGHVIPRQQLKTRNNTKRLRKNRGKNDITNPNNKRMVSIHSAPIYMFQGRKVPARMLCTAPWIKVIAILRNPIDRAYSHYHFVYPEKRKTEKTPSFHQFIMDDISLLKRMGVLRNNWNNTTTEFDKYSRSSAEYTAWEQYVTIAKGGGPVGRGLYSIQLEIWMDEFKKYNKSIEDDMLILQSESSKEYPQDSYHQTVQFLGLEPRTVQKNKHVLGKNHHATDYSGSDGMTESMYNMLYDLYAPYNRRLYNLLGKKEWDGVWDDSSMKIVNVTGIA